MIKNIKDRDQIKTTKSIDQPETCYFVCYT